MALIPCPECTNMVSDSAASCPRCGFSLKKNSNKEVNSPNQIKPKENTGCMKFILGGIVFILLIALISGIADSCKDEKSDSTENYEPSNLDNTIENEDPIQLEKNNLESINKEISSIKNGIDFKAFRGSIQNLQLELILFNSWTKLYEESLNFPNNKEKSTEFKKLIEKVQIAEFPILRKEYAKESDKLMWEHNIEVYVTSNTKILNITGGIFAANKNIKEFQEKLSTALHEFRFKQVNYRWYKLDDEYTYYEIYTGKDSDLVRL